MTAIRWIVCVYALALTMLASVAAGQGPLVPPSGPIEPTGRSLDDVQPRMVIDSLPFVIKENGSYVLTKNLRAGAGQNGIVIDPNVDYVDIDLGGFTIQGPGDGGGVGLLLPAVQQAREAARRMECRNGNIIGFNIGFLAEASSSTASEDYMKITMTDVLISSYQTGGSGAQILLGDGSVRFIRCSFVKNGSDGVRSTPKLQEAIADGCVFSHNGGNGWNILPAVQSPTPGSTSEAPNAVAGASGDVDGRDFLVWRSSFNNNGLNGLLLQATPTGTPDVVPTEEMSLNFEEVKFNGNGLNGFAIGSGPGSHPSEQLSLNFTKVEFSRNKEHGFYFETSPESLPMEQISFVYEEIEWNSNGKAGLHIKDNGSEPTLPAVQMEFNNILAANNGTQGILIGLLLPAVQKAAGKPAGAAGKTAIAAGAGGGPHVRVFDGISLNNSSDGFNISGVSLLDVANSSSSGNGGYGWALHILPYIEQANLSQVKADNNGQGGLNIIAILIGLLNDIQANGNSGNGVQIGNGGENGEYLIENLASVRNTGHGLFGDGSVRFIKDSIFSNNSMNGAMVKMKGAKILQNVFNNNGGHGLITDGTSNTIMLNEASENAQTGISITDGTRNSIQDNKLFGNSVGLAVNGHGNFVFRNVLDNSANFDTTSGNEIAPIQTLGFATSPWANIVPLLPE